MAPLIPGHHITSAKMADMETLLGFVMDGKKHLAINHFLFENRTAELAYAWAAIEDALTNPQADCLLVREDDTEQIVAYLAVTRHYGSRYDMSQFKSPMKAPEGMVPAVFKAVMKMAIDLDQPVGEYMELSYIYVVPSSRRQMIGITLVEICEDRADWEGLPLIVNAEPIARPFFLKRGFRDIKHVNIDLRQWAGQNSGYGVFRMSTLVGPELDSE